MSAFPACTCGHLVVDHDDYGCHDCKQCWRGGRCTQPACDTYREDEK